MYMCCFMCCCDLINNMDFYVSPCLFSFTTLLLLLELLMQNVLTCFSHMSVYPITFTVLK